MRYNTEVTISLPRDRVIEHFDSFENLKEWQTGLISYEAVSGEPGHSEAQTKLTYEMKGKNVEMIETIVRRSLPDEFTATYEAKGVRNFVANKFVDNGTTTNWNMDNEFRFKGFMSILSWFMGGSFKKQTLSDMNSFKAFAEGRG